MSSKVVLVGMLAAAAVVGLPGCRKQSATPSSAPAVAATNSLLECAAKDLLGPETAVLRLAEPGTCPGHFDIRPSQVDEIRRCRVLLRLDFQMSLDAKVGGAAGEGLRIAEVVVRTGLCEPESYLAACRQTADALVAAGLLSGADANGKLEEIAARVEAVSADCRAKVAALQGAPVVASSHQEAFCKWLGLRPAAVFAGADSAGIGQVDEAVRRGEEAGAKLVIANLPEGRKVADALAERLGARVVVFGNFPALGRGQESFDDLLKDNVRLLLEAAGKP